MPTLAEQLFKARKKAGHNQTEAAVHSGVSISTISSVERGEEPKQRPVKAAIERYIEDALKGKK